MRLVFDARHLDRPFTGLGRYTGSLLGALLRLRAGTSMELAVLVSAELAAHNPYARMIEEIAARGECRILHCEARPFSFRHHTAVGRVVRSWRADVYFYPHFDLPLGLHVPSVFVVHDLLPLKVDDYIRRWRSAKRLYFTAMIKHGIRRAQRCYAVSSRTREDLLELVGGAYAAKIAVAYEGAMASLGGECAVEEGLPGTPFLLYVGDRRPHKNLKRTVDIFVALKQQRLYDGRLVIAGSRQDFGFNVERYVADRGDVHVLGPISDAALRQLYHRMDALLLLSKYEGFGLPVVEAASHNKRVVVSDGGSLPEIAPSTACVVPNTMPVELAAAQVGAYLSEAVDIDNAPYMQQFTWDAAARAIFGSYLG